MLFSSSSKLDLVKKEALKEELKTNKAITGGTDMSQVVKRVLTIVLGTHPFIHVMKAVIGDDVSGGLLLESTKNPDLAKAFQVHRSWAAGMKHPFIYAQELADSVGRCPSPRQLRLAIDIVRKYSAGLDYVRQIDLYKKPRPNPTTKPKGYRKYLFKNDKTL